MKSFDISTILGVDPEIAGFIVSCGSSILAVDGAVETVRAPLPSGWPSNSIEVELAGDNDYPLNPQTVNLLMPWKEKLAGTGREIKYRVVVLEQLPKDIPGLRITIVPTTYEESTGFHWSLNEASVRKDDIIRALKKNWACHLLQPGKYNLPGVAVVHVIVTTGDNQIILCQRSENANYHPLSWSTSFEEQINEQDQMFGNAMLSAAAIRGFKEELISDNATKSEGADLLGVFLEYGILNLSFCMHIETSLLFNDIKQNWIAKARDNWEAIDVAGEPFTLDNLVRLLKSHGYKHTSGEIGRFHPSSKYRLLLLALRRFGWDAISGSLK